MGRYEDAWKTIDDNFLKAVRLITLLAQRTLSVKDYQEFVKEFEKEFPRKTDEHNYG